MRRRSVVIGGLAALADEQVGIKAGLQRQDFNVEVFLDQQSQSAFRRFRAGSVRVEVDDDLSGPAAQQLGLGFSEGGAGAGNDVFQSRGEHGDAVHLAFDEDYIIQRLDGVFCEMEVKQHPRL